MVFLFGLYYAAESRVKPPASYEGVEGNLDAKTAENDYSAIKFIEGQHDGLVNATASSDPVNSEPTSTPENDLAEQLAGMIEKQRLAEFDRDNKMQNDIMQRQFALAQEALEGQVDVTVFETATLDGRPQRPLPGTLVPAAARAATLVREGVNHRAVPAQPRNRSRAEKTLSAINAGTLSGTDSAGVIENRAFVSGDYRIDFTLNETFNQPHSQFQLLTGGLIPAVMLSAANSELPGDLIAQVTQDIYDSVTGRYLLIPQGSKLFGRYDSFAALGSERLLMVWDRLILPDGETLTLGSMQGYDDRGVSGAKDRVITHFWRTLMNAFLLSVASSSAEALIDEAEQSDGIVANIKANFGTTSSSAFDDYLRQRLRIKPTFEIRSGYRFNIVVNRDITFPEPFQFGYTQLELR